MVDFYSKSAEEDEAWIRDAFPVLQQAVKAGLVKINYNDKNLEIEFTAKGMKLMPKETIERFMEMEREQKEKKLKS